MKKVFLAGLLLIAMTALFGCGGGGTADVQTAVGRFVDAPVAGLSYVSGSQKGVTGADGSFTYEVGKPVKFTIGDIVLGEAPAAAQMTPIDLSATADANATTPDVLARVQLLMSLSSTDPASGTITIPPATLTAAQGKIMNFASTTAQAELQAIVSALAPAKPMVTTDQATAHFKGTLDKIFITSMIAGKTATHTYDSGSTFYTFAATGNTLIATFVRPVTATSSAGTYNGAWSIDTNGRLIIKLTSVPTGVSYPGIFEIISGSGNNLGVKYAHNDTPTVWEGTGLNFTINSTPTTTPTVFTTTMLAGKTATEKRTNGDTNVFMFATTGNVVTGGGTSTLVGTFTINTNGTLTVTASTGGSITYTIVSGSGNVLAVTRTSSDAPTLVKGPEIMTIS